MKKNNVVKMSRKIALKAWETRRANRLSAIALKAWKTRRKNLKAA